MKYTSLRRVAAAELRARAALAHWPRRDAALTGRLAYSPLPRHPAVVAVHAYGEGLRWRGHVDLGEWLAATAPELAALAGDEGNQYALSLFEAAEQPLVMPFCELAYDVLRIQPDAAPGAHAAPAPCLLSLQTPQGRVWFDEFPAITAPAADELSASLQTLPLLLDWCVGSSRASRRLINSLRCGDVLLIGTEAFELSSAGRIIGRFSINQDGEITVQAASLKQSTAATTPAHADTGVASDMPAMSAIAASLGDIPLRLDFILQRRLMTVAELDALYRGQVLQLDAAAEKQVEITVNGMRLASGELVELNGRLGVELHDIAGGKAFAENHRG